METTAYTASNGAADVVATEGGYVVRVKRTDGSWAQAEGPWGDLERATSTADFYAEQAARRATANVREQLENRLDRVRSFIAEAERRGEDSWGGSSVEYWQGVRDALATSINALASDGLGLDDEAAPVLPADFDGEV